MHYSHFNSFLVDRVFYETLYQQKPESEMAQDWCLAYGILNEIEAKKLNEKVLKRKNKTISASQSSSSSTSNKKSTAVASSPEKSTGRRKRGAAVIEDDIEGDTGLGKSSAWEGRGKTGI